MRSERGFTLIELLLVISIIGILAAMALQGFHLYRSKAGYAAVESLMSMARTALEAGIMRDPDSLPAAVAPYTQTSQGLLSNAAARALLPTVQVGKNIKFQVSYDPTCTDGGCQLSFLQVDHCFATEYDAYVRLGDGSELFLEHIPGGGCS